MKRLSRPSVALAFLLAVAITPLVFAQNNNAGPSANGDFVFSAGDLAKSLTFDARIQNNGQTHGQISYVGVEDIGSQDVDGGGDTNPSGTSLTMTVDVDCLRITGNRAVMAGAITSSSVSGYIGVRTLLVVEDGGEGVNNAADRFTWGVYRGGNITWVPTDAELLFDSGAGMSWYASDAERNDDVPVPKQAGASSNPPVNCQSFSLASYDLRDVEHGAGNIQVKPQ